MTQRHPICPHTLQAVRSRRIAFEAELRLITKLSATQIKAIGAAAERTMAELDERDMPEVPAKAPRMRG